MKHIGRIVKRRRWCKAVTPALATMLLLVLIITITMAVMVWGMPRIQGMQGDASYKMAKSHFEVLDDNIYSLCKGNVGDSVSSPVKFSTGTYSITNDADFWIIMYQLTRNYNVIFEDLEDGDNKVDIYEAQGQSLTGATVNVSWPLLDKTEKATDQAIYPKGAKYYFTTKYKLDSAAKFTLNLNGKDIAEAWVISLDAISVEMDTAGGGFEIQEINNALISNYPHKRHVETGPDFHLNHETRTFIANFAKFDVNGMSSAGKGGYDVNLRLKTIGIGMAPAAQNLRMEFTGEYKDAWYHYFTEQFSLLSTQKNSMNFVRDGSGGEFTGLLLDTPSDDDPFNLNQVSFKIRINLIEVQTEAIS